MTDKTTEAFEAWWSDTGEQSLYALNTTTDDDIKILAGLTWEAAIREALAESVKQEPVAWQPIGTLKPTSDELDILMGDGSILCNVLTQSDGDLWWDGSGTGEKFIDPNYADVTHWRKHSDSTPPTAALAAKSMREAAKHFTRGTT